MVVDTSCNSADGFAPRRDGAFAGRAFAFRALPRAPALPAPPAFTRFFAAIKYSGQISADIHSRYGPVTLKMKVIKRLVKAGVKMVLWSGTIDAGVCITQ